MYENYDGTNLCKICSYSAADCLELENHVLLVHKQFMCSICDKTYTRRDSLKLHMNSHTGAKPFKCEFCGMTFAHRFTRLTHRKKHLMQMKNSMI